MKQFTKLCGLSGKTTCLLKYLAKRTAELYNCNAIHFVIFVTIKCAYSFYVEVSYQKFKPDNNQINVTFLKFRKRGIHCIYGMVKIVTDKNASDKQQRDRNSILGRNKRSYAFNCTDYHNREEITKIN